MEVCAYDVSNSKNEETFIMYQVSSVDEYIH